jgi:GDP-L-fucose synthase
VTGLEGKRVWVAGHRGMVGRALVERLSDIAGLTLVVAGRDELDLRDREATRRWVKAQRPDLAFIAAARVGGILANDSYPVDFLEDNLLIELSAIRAAFDAGVEKLLFLGSSCIYPKLAPQPISEDSLLTAPLEPTNQWYAIAKIAGISLCDAFRKQYGAAFISAMPTNLYGPGDNYDLHDAHVLAAAIRKIHEAKVNGRATVTIWGTGTPLREFMHVADLADALVFLMQHYDAPGPINVGSGDEISILGLHEAIRDIIGWQGDFVFDATRPDGTPRKLMDSRRLRDLGWQASTDLHDGLADTYRRFVATRAAKA